MKGFLGNTSGKEPSCQCRRCERQGFNPWVGKIPWRRAMATHSSNSCLESPTDRGAQWATVHGVTESQTWLKRLSMHPCMKLGPAWWDWHPYKKRHQRFYFLSFSLPCDKARKQLSASQRAFTWTWPCWHPGLWLSASKTVKSKFLLFEQLSLRYFIMEKLSGHVDVSLCWCMTLLSNGSERLGSPLMVQHANVASCPLYVNREEIWRKNGYKFIGSSHSLTGWSGNWKENN